MTWPNAYQTGTASVAPGDTVVVGVGTFWSPLADQANLLFLGSDIGFVDDVSDATHLAIPPWQGGTYVNSPYRLVQFPKSSLQATKDIRDFLAKLATQGIPYIVPDNGTPDDAIGDDDTIAIRFNPSPITFWRRVSGHYVFQGSLAYASTGTRYDVTVFYPNRPADGESILEFEFSSIVTFPAGLAGFRASAQVAATAQSVFSLKKNGVAFGTMTFAAGAAVATFASSADAICNDRDIYSIVTPTPRDNTLRGLRVICPGVRPV